MMQMSQPYLIQKTNTIITVASWEERFILGMQRLISEVKPERIILFYYQEYADWTLQYREQLSDICNAEKIELITGNALSFLNPLESWKNLFSGLENLMTTEQMITLDITTMPREAIWSIAYELDKKEICTQFSYHKHREYADWLSRDPDRPRLLYKQAGIQYLGRQTALIIQTGYDVDRVKQLERLFEPDKVILGLQTGTQYGNYEQNRKKHEEAFSGRRDIELFDVDGYSVDNTFEAFASKISSLADEYNIVLSSLGPKIGALALFRVKKMYPDIALCYAPSNDFNHDYSKGITESIYGVLNYLL